MGFAFFAVVLLAHCSLVSSYDLYAREDYTGPFTDGGSWTSGFAQAKALVDQMVNITTGYTGKCVGFTGEVPRLNLRALCLQDGPAGVRPVRRVSQFPAGVTTAATWNRDLMAARATALGQEFHEKELGPVTGGPLGRSPYGGRNWEGIVTCAKHFIAYEQETFRNPYGLADPAFPPFVQSPISSNFDDRTAHEVYLWPFAEAVRAGTGAVMCSYNEINQTHSCSDDHTLNQILKTELGYQESSAIGGLDVSMPGTADGGVFGDFFGDQLIALVNNGSVSEARLTDMVCTSEIIRDIGEEALTLVKNNRQSGGGLPFPAPSSMGSLAVIGEDAGPSPYGATSCGQTGSACLIENNGTMTIGGGSGWAYLPTQSTHLRRSTLCVAAVNNNTIVVMHIPGPIVVEEWVTAVLIAHLPGPETGNSLVPVLWGEKSPSGKLPYTVAKNESDWPPNTIVSDPLLVDYKWFDAKNITPRFEFGFGLSYTTFKFGTLSIARTFKPFAKQSDPGNSMYDILYTATVDVANDGAVQGAEVAQLYLSFPASANEPPFVLRGFDKLDLAPGQQQTATFELTRKDLSVWDVVINNGRVVPQGTFTVSVGASSRDLRSVITHNFA
ncbi:glycoside hydrolase superfamily [Mycena galopus ATCC 62051]|nr:glycoside hydrolase superfamily [Mycena galopus ATCC 62051]